MSMSALDATAGSSPAGGVHESVAETETPEDVPNEIQAAVPGLGAETSAQPIGAPSQGHKLLDSQSLHAGPGVERAIPTPDSMSAAYSPPYQPAGAATPSSADADHVHHVQAIQAALAAVDRLAVCLVEAKPALPLAPHDVVWLFLLGSCRATTRCSILVQMAATAHQSADTLAGALEECANRMSEYACIIESVWMHDSRHLSRWLQY
jgi:hypothetical protein